MENIFNKEKKCYIMLIKDKISKKTDGENE